MGKKDIYIYITRFDDKIWVFFFRRPNCALLTMMKDQFANYVVQKVSFSFNFE